MPCARYQTLAPAVADLLAELPPQDHPAAGCIGVAGPVFDGRVHMTNLGWDLDARAVSAAAGCPVRLVNDFHAQAMAMPRISEWVSIGPEGTPDPAGAIAVLGPGTGLGEAILVPGPRGWIAVPGEGAHARFAPQDEREVELLRHFWRRWPDHVSVERVVSGQGLVDVYDFLRGDAPRHPDMARHDPAAVVSRLGLSGECARCAEALRIFVRTFADEAANVALQCNAAVVYLSGGISPRILPALRRHFPAAFRNKGRYGAWLATVPLRVVTHPDPGLLGATLLARELSD